MPLNTCHLKTAARWRDRGARVASQPAYVRASRLDFDTPFSGKQYSNVSGSESKQMRISRSVPYTDIRLLLVIGIILIAFDSIIERISVIIGRKAQTKIETDVRRKSIEIEDVSKDIFSVVDMNYLLVRYGVNEFLEQDPAPRDKRKMKIRNKEFAVETDYQDRSRTVKVTVPFRVHKNLPTEFKLFVDVEDADMLETVKEEFETSPSCESASISDSLEDRVYILLTDFETTEAPEGFQNNVVYPK
jgi:hypothetical protein